MAEPRRASKIISRGRARQEEARSSPRRARRLHPNTCPGCSSHYRDDELRAELRVCRLRPPLHRGRARAHRAARRPRHVRGGRERAALGRPARVRRPEAVPRAARRGRAATGLDDAMVAAAPSTAPLRARTMEFQFLGGSMGSVVGEKFARAVDLALEDSMPLISVASSGGARMQENVLALMQMAKTTCAVDALNEAGIPFVSVLSHPTTGGVMASFAALGDVIIAEPGALMSFAGPRVVQQTTREQLPDDFGLAESNFRFGHIDMIVPRHELRGMLARLLRLFAGGEFVPCEPDGRGAAAPGVARARAARSCAGARTARDTNGGPSEEAFAPSSAGCAGASPSARPSRTSGMRSSSRATTSARTRSTTPSACSTTSPSCTATGWAARTPRSSPGSVASAAARSRSSATRRAATSSSAPTATSAAQPEGYGKAIRVFELASRLGFPVLTLVDTQGAHPGLSPSSAARPARSRARCSRWRGSSAVRRVVIGEGGSGGALAIAVADRVLMMENSIYSVISPEGGAAILWRDADQRRKAAAAFKPTARFCLELGVIDGVVPEPSGGAQQGPRPGGADARRRDRARVRDDRGRAGRAAPPPPPRALPRAGRVARDDAWTPRRSPTTSTTTGAGAARAARPRPATLDPHARREHDVDHDQGERLHRLELAVLHDDPEHDQREHERDRDHGSYCRVSGCAADEPARDQQRAGHQRRDLHDRVHDHAIAASPSPCHA